MTCRLSRPCSVSLVCLLAACSNDVDETPGFSTTSSSTTLMSTSLTGASTSDGSTGTDTAATDTAATSTGSTTGSTTSSSTGAGSSTGEPEPVCGNGVLEGAEECDDGNAIDADGCEADCTKPACDNDIVDPQEICQTLAGTFDAGTDPLALAVADVNGDGTDDVLTISPNDNQMSKFEFSPEGLPTGVSDYLAGLTPTRIGVGDIEADMDIDVIILADGTNEVIRLLNDGNGEFGPNDVLMQANDPSNLLVGQADLDGKLDFVVADTVTIVIPNEPIWMGPALRVFKGDAMGGFTQGGQQQADGAIQDFQFAKIDNDGLPDYVVITQAPSVIQVYAGSTVGNVDPAGTSALPGKPLNFAVGEVNDDGQPDVVVSVEGETDLYLFTGDGNAQFQSKDTFPVNAETTAVAFANLDSDDKLDVVAATNLGEIHFLRRVGPSQFITERIETISGAAFDLGVSDFNGDGLDDVVATVPEMGKLEVLLSQP